MGTGNGGQRSCQSFPDRSPHSNILNQTYRTDDHSFRAWKTYQQYFLSQTINAFITQSHGMNWNLLGITGSFQAGTMCIVQPHCDQRKSNNSPLVSSSHWKSILSFSWLPNPGTGSYQNTTFYPNAPCSLIGGLQVSSSKLPFSGCKPIRHLISALAAAVMCSSANQ